MSLEVVYRDDSYPSSWISSQWSTDISTFLNGNGFDIVNAIQLRDWMQLRITSDDCGESVAVFSQDIVPDTVLGEYIPNVLIRKYLDNGGRIVWIGDIPFWTKGSQPNLKQEIWKHGAHDAMLHVQPLIADSSSTSQWVGKWNELLTIKWYSQRPIAFEYQEFKEKRRQGITHYPMAYAEVILSPVSWNALIITRWKKAGTRIGGFGLDLPLMGGLNTEISENYPEELSLNPKKLVIAWHSVFDKAKPLQGFYRLWDTGSTQVHPPSPLLDDIHTVAMIH